MRKAGTFVAPVSSKGQVTIPAKLRRQLHILPGDQVVLRVEDGRLVIEPLPMTLEEAFGSVSPLGQPNDADSIKQINGDERAIKWQNKSNR
jgi:AbrB family looped-hinge helix DNA binding protein